MAIFTLNAPEYIGLGAIYGNNKVLLLWCYYAKSQYCTLLTMMVQTVARYTLKPFMADAIVAIVARP